MKRISSVFLLLLSIYLYGCSNNPRTSKENGDDIDYYKKNKVKIVKEYWYDYKYGKIDSSSKDHFLVKYYDSLGTNTKSVFYHKSLEYKNYYSSPYWKIDSNVIVDEPQYDKMGNILGITTKNGSGLILYKYTYKDNNIETTLEYDSIGGVESKTFYNYNSGKLSSTKKYNGSGDLITNENISYDGDRINLFEIYEKGKLKFRKTLNKGSKSGDLSYSIYDLDDSLVVKKVSILKGDSLKEIVDYDKDNFPIRKYVYKYLKNGLVDYQIWYTNNEPEKFIKYIYEYRK